MNGTTGGQTPDYITAHNICESYISLCESDMQCSSGTLKDMIRNLESTGIPELDELKNTKNTKDLNNHSLAHVIYDFMDHLPTEYN